MSELDVKHYAEKLLNITKKFAGDYSYPIPVKRIRSICSYVLEKNAPKEKLEMLTDVEVNVLHAIKADFAQGITPSARTIAKRLGYKSPSSSNVVITRLVRKGYVERQGQKKQIVVVSFPDGL